MVPLDDHVRCSWHLKHFIHLRQIVDSGDSEVVHETWPPSAHIHVEEVSQTLLLSNFIGICPHKVSKHTTHSLIGASLSGPHTSVTSLHPCVCMFACLLACLPGPTSYHKSLPALILHILRYSKRAQVNSEQSTSSMVTTRTEMEIIRGLTYSVPRAIEVTAWKSDNAVPVTGLRSLLAIAIEATNSTCQKRWL